MHQFKDRADQTDYVLALGDASGIKLPRVTKFKQNRADDVSVGNHGNGANPAHHGAVAALDG